MEISKEVQEALISLVALAKTVISKDLATDDGSIEIIEQFLFDCEVDEEKFEAFPRLSSIEIEDEIGDQIHELKKDEKDDL